MPEKSPFEASPIKPERTREKKELNADYFLSAISSILKSYKIQPEAETNLIFELGKDKKDKLINFIRKEIIAAIGIQGNKKQILDELSVKSSNPTNALEAIISESLKEVPWETPLTHWKTWEEERKKDN